MNDLNQKFPAGPSSEPPEGRRFSDGPSAEKDDLLAQISAQDENGGAKKRRKSAHSILMEFVVLFMKFTFVLDDAKRKNQKIFDTAVVIWGAFAGLIYLSGLCMLCLLIYSYIHLPEIVRNSLMAQGIVVKDYQIKNYSLSRVELDDLEDKNGMYTIKKMFIHSTFSDFIKGRVKSVVLDGVRVKIKETKKGLELGALPQALLDINQSNVTKKIKVDSLSLTNAVLEINGKDYNFPVSFSLTGVYEKDSKISIPLFIKEKNANIVGSLSVMGNSKEMKFVLKITSGTLTLPQRSPENINGEMTIVTRKMVPEKVTGEFNLSYGPNMKKINIELDKGRDNSYSGNIDLAFANLDSLDRKKEVKSSLSLNFEGLSIKSMRDFATVKPIKIVIQSFQNQDILLSNVSLTLNGELGCENQVCSYRVRQFSPIFVKESSVLFNSDIIKSNNEYSFSLAPNNKDTVVWKESKLSYDVNIERATFSGYKNARLSPVSLSAAAVGIKGFYDFANMAQKLTLSIQRLIAITPEFSLTNASFRNDDVFDENSHITLSAGKVSLVDNNVFKAPFKLTMDKNGLETKAVLGLDNNTVQVSFSGLSRLLSGEFKGNVFLHPIDLKKLSMPVDQLSGLFPAGIENLNGRVAGLGSVYWKNSKQITGPLYISFDDVGFRFKDVTVSGMNTVLSLQTISPLLTPSGQKIFIKKIEGAVPFQNVLMDLKLEPQFIKLSAMTAFMAGIPMQADAALIATRSSAFTLFFRNNAVDWASANPYLNLNGALISGKGSVLLPIEVRDGVVSVKNAEAKITNGDISLAKAKGSVFAENFGSATGFFIRTGSVFMNSGEKDDIVDVTLSLEGRLQPTQQIKNIKETFSQPIGKIISPMKSSPIPPEIVKKQHIISK